MPKTDLLFDNTQQKLLNGVHKVAQAVTVTLGPKGQNVLISTPYGAPLVLHDGVFVASSIDLKDDAENQGAWLVKQAAQKTNQETGDGTTTTVLFLDEFVSEGVKLVTAKMNAMNIRKGMEIALKEVKEKMQPYIRPITPAEWKDIAIISAQDEEIGTKIAEAFEKVGENGSINIEEGATDHIQIEYQDGMTIEKGWFSPHFVNEYNYMKSILEDVEVIVTDCAINTMSDVRAIGTVWEKSHKPMLIIADNFSIEATRAFIQNKLKGLPFLLVQAPEYGDRRKQVLEDIAIATNAKFISSELGMEIKNITPEDLGNAKKVVSDQHSTLIVSKGDPEIVKTRVESIKHQMESIENLFQKEFLQKRIAKLTDGIVMIYAGGKTDVENREVTERIKDAKGATKAAIEEGIVIGGGTIFYQISKELNQRLENQEQQAGYDLVKRGLTKPLERLVENSGDNSGYILREIDLQNATNNSTKFGYNAYTGKVEDLEVAKVIDPAKVLRVSLENSVSVAGSIITAACLVIGEPPKEQ